MIWIQGLPQRQGVLSDILEYDHGEVAMVYGKGETFTFGSVSSIQFSLYDKGKAIDKKGERELWEPIWSQKLDHMYENQL